VDAPIASADHTEPVAPSATASAQVSPPPSASPQKKPSAEKKAQKGTPERIQGIDGIEIIP
jgi:hypothetical protein